MLHQYKIETKIVRICEQLVKKLHKSIEGRGRERPALRRRGKKKRRTGNGNAEK